MSRLSTAAALALLLASLTLAMAPATVSAQDTDGDGVPDASDNCPTFCVDEVTEYEIHPDTTGYWNHCYERHPGSTVYSGVLSLRDRVVSPSFFDPVTGSAPVMSIGCCTSDGFPAFDPLPGNYDSTTGFGSVSSNSAQILRLQFHQAEYIDSVSVGHYHRQAWGSSVWINNMDIEYLDDAGNWQVFAQILNDFASTQVALETYPLGQTTTSVRFTRSRSPQWIGIGTVLFNQAGRCATVGGNPDQADYDGDGIGDICDDYYYSAINDPYDMSVLDLDLDGVCDSEQAGYVPPLAPPATEEELDEAIEEAGGPAACLDGNGNEVAGDLRYVPSLGKFVTDTIPGDGSPPVLVDREGTWYEVVEGADMACASE